MAPFLDDTKRLVLMGDWNVILDPKIDKVGRGVSRLGRCENSLVDLMALPLVGRQVSSGSPWKGDVDVAR